MFPGETAPEGRRFRRGPSYSVRRRCPHFRRSVVSFPYSSERQSFGRDGFRSASAAHQKTRPTKNVPQKSAAPYSGKRLRCRSRFPHGHRNRSNARPCAPCTVRRDRDFPFALRTRPPLAKGPSDESAFSAWAKGGVFADRNPRSAVLFLPFRRPQPDYIR